MYAHPPPPAAPFHPAPQSSWDHVAMLNAAYSNGGLTSAPTPEWYLDNGASSHVTGTQGTLTSSSSPLMHLPSSILVDNGQHLPITATGSTTLPLYDFRLTDIHVSPTVVTSLISVRKFTKDNSCSINFYPCGFLVKDLRTRKILMVSVSNGILTAPQACVPPNEAGTLLPSAYILSCTL
ncbi:hypothetical protein D1007_30193 [Hordeum vulgare]|nr:hypothetical protein D1007_30193 [Hordeum vulgare]